MRKAVIGVLTALLVLGLVVILLPRLFPLDFLKPRIVAALEERTGREVDFGRLSLSLFPGIGVKITDLSMSGGPRHPGENHLSVPEAEIRMALLPLFRGRAVFTKVILRRPDVRLYRYADGTTSLSEIAEGLSVPEEAPPPEDRDAVAFDLRSLRIEEAGLLLVLESEEGEETRWEITPLDVRLSEFGRDRRSFDVSTRVSGAVQGEVSLAGTLAGGPADGAYDLRGEGKVFGQPVTVEGVLPVPPAGDGAGLTLDFPNIAMDRIPGVFATPPPWLADLSLSGTGRLTVRVSGSLEAAGFTAEADLTQAGFSTGPEFRKPADKPLTVVVQGRQLPDRILISDAEVRFPPLLLTANAAYVPSTGAREWKASALIPQLSELVRASDGRLAPYAPSGRLTASGQGDRPSTEAEERWQASLELGDVGFRLPDQGYDFEGLEGRVEANPRAVSFQPLAGLFNGQRFSLRGPVALGPVPEGRLDLRMAYLDLDALFPPDREESPRKRTQPPSREETPGEPREVAARVGVQVDAGMARGVEFRDLRGTAVYEKGGLELDSLRARVFGGSVGLSGRIGFARPDSDFRVNIQAQGLAAGDVLSRQAALGDFLTGETDLELSISGGMESFAEFARTASGSGSIHVAGGTIKGIDLLATAIDLADLDAILPAARETRTAAARGETRFQDLSADFRLDGGRIRTDSLRIVSDAMGLAGTAAIGLDRTLEFRGTLRLSPDLSAQARGIAGMFLLDPAGRVEIPLVVSGPLTSPAIAVDTEAVARGAEERLKRELLERIPIPRDAAPQPGAPDNVEEVPERPDAEKAIRGLFEKLLPEKK
jgi:hypothetical protein